MVDFHDEINRITGQAIPPIPPVDRGLLNLLRHCRPHVSARAIDGRGDSRAVLRWLDEAIAQIERAQAVEIPAPLRKKP